MDYLLLMLKYKWSVILIVGISGIAAFASTYIVPQTYEAEAWILPPDRLSSYGLLERFSSGFAIQMLKEVENPSVDLIQNFLESRRLAERLASDSAIHH